MEITANGVHPFGPIPHGGQACIQLTGTFGGGSAAVGFVPTGGSFLAFPGASSTLTSGSLLRVDVPFDALLAISLSGATNPTLKAHCWLACTPTTNRG